MKIKFNHTHGDYIQIDSAKIYFEEIGNPEKPVIVMLHGGFGNIEDYNSMTPYLAEHFRIIGVDSRGQGKSTLGTNGLNYEQMCKDTEAVLTKLNINKVTIIGFSDGGIIGYRMALADKIKVDKLITIGATWHRNDIKESKEIFDRITAETWKNKFPKTYEVYQNLNPTPNFDIIADAIINLWKDERDCSYPNEKVKSINCPTLLIKGEKDHLFSKESIMKLSSIIKDSTLLIIPNAGHEAYIDQPNIVKTTLSKFLQIDS